MSCTAGPSGRSSTRPPRRPRGPAPRGRAVSGAPPSASRSPSWRPRAGAISRPKRGSSTGGGPSASAMWMSSRPGSGSWRRGRSRTSSGHDLRAQGVGAPAEERMSGTRSMTGLASPSATLRGPRLWLRAFVGFYPPRDSAAAHLDPVAKFLFSARSVILVISFQAATIAGLLAAADGRFDTASFVLVLIGLVTAHAISNLSNDYFGYRRGHDTPDSPRPRYTIPPLASRLFDAERLVRGLA